MSLMELTGVYYAYPGEKEYILKDFSMRVEEGECLIITGDNGSGKTTLFRLLNGLIFAERGKYIYSGEEINEKFLKNNRRSKLFHKNIAYLFQNPDIMLFNGRVYDEIAFGPRQMGLSEEESDKRVNDCMSLFGIEELAEKAPYHLSGGQKKKVALASILSLNPDILILDEPYAGLDKNSKSLLRNFLCEWNKAGKTLILSGHEEAYDFPARIINLSTVRNEENTTQGF